MAVARMAGLGPIPEIPAAMDSFISTRGAGPAPFREALFRGMAPDGGLYVPRSVPALEGIPPVGAGFSATARWVARRWLAGAAAPDVVDGIVEDALDFPVPLVEVEPGAFVLELFHGPSLAFKDVGARFMARAMAALGGGEGTGGRRTVLVATSGDTGGAVAAAFHGLPGVRVVTLFPEGGISERQRRQMSALGDNVTAMAVAGTFDDCQRLAKQAFADAALREEAGLTSANSINVARLIPQAFYYVHAAALLGWDREPATFVVPSGNLGNLCAGLLARRAGMPAAGFVAATNANRVFPDYLESGRFAAAPSVPTLSNAMDVGDPSNLERIRWLYGNDLARLRADVLGTAVTDDETRATLADVHERSGYVLDPHGAVGWRALERARGAGAGPWVVLATAHPAKFPEVVAAATGRDVPVPEALAARLRGDEHVIRIPAELAALRGHLLEREGR